MPRWPPGSRPALIVALALACRAGIARARDAATVQQGVDFRGWQALVLRNRQLEAVVVPAIGRIVALRLLRDGARGADPFWLHPKLGRDLAPDDNGWINFGGDKAWPAPQSDWQRIAGRAWPPPVTFDARPYAAEVVGSSTVRMTSQVDPAYGMRVRRDIQLAGDEMIVDTTYEKLAGAPVRAAVWTITQLTSPDRIVRCLLPERSSFPGRAPQRDAGATQRRHRRRPAAVAGARSGAEDDARQRR